MSVVNYIKELLAREEYSFSLNELRLTVDKNDISIKKELERLSEKGEIINLRKGFYLIITPRYSSLKKLPLQLYCEKLFRQLDRKYYVGLFSAAKFHGASHQQVHREYIITDQPKLKDISKTALDIRFFTSRNWPKENIELKKSDAGYYKISSPALTIVDLIHHQTKLGGINRMLATIEELAEDLTKNDITDLLSWYSNTSTIQRFGFLLEHLELKFDIQQTVLNKLRERKFYPVLLSPRSNQKAGAVNNKWKIDVNIRIDNDL